MNAFQYITPASASRAQELAQPDTAAYLAGGNDLLGRMKEGINPPSLLVNLKQLPELSRIEPGAASWKIGALTVLSELENHAGLKQTFPALYQAVAEVGSLQIRNVATVGGNLAQHSRCWYYRHRDLVCWKKGGDTCHAREGDNRYHSLFTGCACISPVVSNLAIALAALSATVVILHQGKETELSIGDLYAKAWADPAVHNSLSQGDLILRVQIPASPRRSAYLQVSEKTEFDWALVSCAAAGQVQDGKISSGRVVLGAVAPVPFVVDEVSRLLEGQVLDEAVAEQAASLMVDRATPLAGNSYKVPLAKALVKRTLLKLKS
jgi:xanthine dehydrogenase YagS FAD-binding subunit